MLDRFQSHISQTFPFLLDRPFLIAVSGGIDSVVLAHLCATSQLDFAICHCNFQLRGSESDEDEIFVKNLAKQFDKTCFTTSFETEQYSLDNKVSIQVAARDLRYDWFYSLLYAHRYDYVLTAHNTNDNLETFLINLTRGSGLEGFTGIPPMNNKSVRPMLPFSRDDIMMYAIKKGIEWREDRSNANVKYLRNKVRHKVLPVLKEMNPHLLESFQNTLTYLNESQQMVKDRVDEISKKVLENPAKNYQTINIKELKKLSNPKAYLYAILKDYGFTEWDDVKNLLDSQSGKQLFSKTHRLVKNRTDLLLSSLQDYQEPAKEYLLQNETSTLTAPLVLTLTTTEQLKGINKEEIVVDKDLLKFPLRVRKWAYGDYFCPVGMKGTKKVSQFFKDRKMSLLQKEQTWLLANADNEIIWVIGMRQDRRSEISDQTQNKLKISLS